MIFSVMLIKHIIYQLMICFFLSVSEKIIVIIKKLYTNSVVLLIEKFICRMKHDILKCIADFACFQSVMLSMLIF